MTEQELEQEYLLAKLKGELAPAEFFARGAWQEIGPRELAEDVKQSVERMGWETRGTESFEMWKQRRSVKREPKQEYKPSPEQIEYYKRMQKIRTERFLKSLEEKQQAK
jgi:hypothetical protein